MNEALCVFGAVIALGGRAASADADAPAGVHDFDVRFEDCTEYVGIGWVPFDAARALVPESYTPTKVTVDGREQAILVVRVSGCEAVSVDGKNARPGQVMQVGISAEGLDTSADINNVTLFYVTDSGQLAGKLTAAGVPVALDPHMTYSLEQGDAGWMFDSQVDAAQVPLVSLSGSVTDLGEAAVPFTANWWADGPQGQVSMRTEFPDIVFGTAKVTLTTDPGSVLESLIGPGEYSFALLDSYNTFDAALMEVRDSP